MALKNKQSRSKGRLLNEFGNIGKLWLSSGLTKKPVFPAII